MPDIFDRITETIFAAKKAAAESGKQLFASDIASAIRAAFPNLCEAQKKTAPAKMAEQEWLDSLHAEPSLAGVNIATELAKAQFWCKNNNRKCTRRFLVNWLGKAERNVVSKGGHMITFTPQEGPNGWRSRLNELYPENTFSGTWSMLPESIRREISA